MVKAIIFDLWNTLAEKKISISKTLCDYFDLNQEGFLEEYEKATQLYERKNPREFALGFLEYFGLPKLEKNICFIADTLESAFDSAELLPKTKDALSSLKQNYKLSLLSNTNNIEVIKKDWGIERLFDSVNYSWEIKSLKPSEESFKTAYRKLNILPEDCLFVDDNEKNIHAAKKLGMKTLHRDKKNLLEDELSTYLKR